MAKGITQEELLQKTTLLLHITERFEFAGIVVPFDSQLCANERNFQANLKAYEKMSSANDYRNQKFSNFALYQVIRK